MDLPGKSSQADQRPHTRKCLLAGSFWNSKPLQKRNHGCWWKKKSLVKKAQESLWKKRQSPGNSQQQKEKQNLAMLHWAAAAAVAPARAQPHRHPLQKRTGPTKSLCKKRQRPCGHRLAWGFSDHRVGSGQGT